MNYYQLLDKADIWFENNMAWLFVSVILLGLIMAGFLFAGHFIVRKYKQAIWRYKLSTNKEVLNG